MKKIIIAICVSSLLLVNVGCEIRYMFNVGKTNKIEKTENEINLSNDNFDEIFEVTNVERPYEEDGKTLIYVRVDQISLKEPYKSTFPALETTLEANNQWNLTDVTETVNLEKPFVGEQIKETNSEPWEHSQLMVPTFINDKVVTLQKTDYVYSGGAHGSTFIEPISYYWESGERVPLTDYVKDLDRFFDLIDEELQKNYDVEADLFPEYKENLKQIKDGDFNMCWGLAADGIEVVFQQYVLAPYSTGIVTVVIPYEKLS